MSSINDRSTSRIKVELDRHVGIHEVYLAGTNICIGMLLDRGEKGCEVYDAWQELIADTSTLDEGVEYLKRLYESEVN